MTPAETQMDLEIIILSEESQRKTISYDTPYMWNQNKWYKWTYLQNRNRVTDVENKLMVTKGARGGRDKLGDWDWHIHTTIYKINKDLLYSTGNSTQYSVMTYMG